MPAGPKRPPERTPFPSSRSNLLLDKYAPMVEFNDKLNVLVNTLAFDAFPYTFIDISLTLDRITHVLHPLCDVDIVHYKQLDVSFYSHSFDCGCRLIFITAVPMSPKCSTRSKYWKGKGSVECCEMVAGSESWTGTTALKRWDLSKSPSSRRSIWSPTNYRSATSPDRITDWCCHAKSSC